MKDKKFSLTFLAVMVAIVCVLGGLLYQQKASSSQSSGPSPSEVSRRFAEMSPKPPAPGSGLSHESAVPIKYGQTYRWDDGLKIKVEAPKPYKLEPGVVSKHKHHVVFTVTVISLASYTESQYFDYNVTGGELVYGEGTGWPDKIFKSRPMTFKVVYGVKSVKDVKLSLNPYVDPSMSDVLIDLYVVWK